MTTSDVSILPTGFGDAQGKSDAAVLAPQPLVFSKSLVKKPALALERARLARIAGRPEQGRQLLERTIQCGGWLVSKLWWELVALMSGPDDYAAIRDLWRLSPRACHGNPSVLRAVARAAAVSGNHDECRTLLRKLIVITSARASGAAVKATSKESGKGDGKFAERAAEALSDLNCAFSQVGLRAFLISGTLLGQVRDGGIIGWDKDIDVGFFSEECTTDLEDCFLRHGKFRMGRVDLTSDRLRVIHENGMWIDVFPHYQEGGRRWHNGTATRWWNTPFELDAIDFLGVKQFVPDNSERYLDENYGDWRVPNKYFDARMDAPNVEIIDAEHFVSLLYFGLESSIRANKQVMQRRYTGLLRERGEGAWLDRLGLDSA